jgi:hypothetical protein
LSFLQAVEPSPPGIDDIFADPAILDGAAALCPVLESEIEPPAIELAAHRRSAFVDGATGFAQVDA